MEKQDDQQTQPTTTPEVVQTPPQRVEGGHIKVLYDEFKSKLRERNLKRPPNKILVLLLLVIFLFISIIFFMTAGSKKQSEFPEATPTAQDMEKYLYTVDDYLNYKLKNKEDIDSLNISYDTAVAWSRIKLSEVPEKVLEFPNLYEFYFNNHDLDKFPLTIAKLVKLKKLSVNNNRISKVPAKLVIWQA